MLNRLKFFPISFFSIILWLWGTTIVFQKIEILFHFNFEFSKYLLWLTIISFFLLLLFFILKCVFFRDEVIKDFWNPVKLNFFPTLSIGLLLISIALFDTHNIASKYFWFIWTLVHLLFTLKIIWIWIHHSHFEIKHINPAWFIPAVWNILVPVVGISHFNPELSWFFFSVWFIFWIVLFSIIFNRIIFHSPLQDKLLPTLFIMIAPPAVWFISLVKLTWELNIFSKIMYYIALFLFMLLLSQIRYFSKIKFYLSWRAFSFPISAITIATILMYNKSSILFFKYLSILLFAILIFLVIWLSIRTIKAIFSKEICVED